MKNGKSKIAGSFDWVIKIVLGFLILNFQVLSFNSISQAALVKSVDSVGMTVADLDRSVEFFCKVLGFEKVSEVEVHGSEYENLQAVFGLRMRVARLKLGHE